MAKRKSRPAQVEDYRHDATHKNNPLAGMVQYEAVRETPQEHYTYDPHLSPQLVWAGKPGLTQIEVEDEAGVEVVCRKLCKLSFAHVNIDLLHKSCNTTE
jgi:hypothetical protein